MTRCSREMASWQGTVLRQDVVERHTRNERHWVNDIRLLHDTDDLVSLLSFRRSSGVVPSDSVHHFPFFTSP